jgi:hypothetical protein
VSSAWISCALADVLIDTYSIVQDLIYSVSVTLHSLERGGVSETNLKDGLRLTDSVNPLRSNGFLQRQEIQVKTQDSRSRNHQDIYLSYLSVYLVKELWPLVTSDINFESL